MVEDSNTEKSSSEISTMVRHLYKDALLATISPAGFALYKLRYFLSIVRPRYRLLWKRSISYLNEGIQTAAQKIVSLPEQIRESEMVNYWKDFIRGIPEYSSLVRAKKFKEIENILTTLATHNEILSIQEDRIQDIHKAVKELKDETGKL